MPAWLAKEKGRIGSPDRAASDPPSTPLLDRTFPAITPGGRDMRVTEKPPVIGLWSAAKPRPGNGHTAYTHAPEETPINTTSDELVIFP